MFFPTSRVLRIWERFFPRQNRSPAPPEAGAADSAVSPSGHPRRTAWFAAAALAVTTALLAARGIHWERLHPDEGVVTRRAREEARGIIVHGQVYPAGYYKLTRVLNRVDHVVTDAVRGLAGWTEQDGASDAKAIPADPSTGAPLARSPLLLRIREWNVWLAACSTLLVFFLLRALFGGGLLAPALGTLVYAVHPFGVEHSHYAETDAGMIATGALAFLLMALSLRRLRPWLLLAAAFAAGFTITMKFSYLPFVVTIPVEAVVLARRRGWKWRCAAALAAATLALMLAGYLAGTPMLLLEPKRYFALSQIEKARVFAENLRVLKRLAGTPFPNQYVKGRAMLTEAARLGWGWWLWMAACVPLWFSRSLRAQWAGVPLFGLFYAPFAFLLFPWFRQQEYLPMLPFLAATCALPLALARHAPSRVAAFLAVLVCAASTLRDGVRVSSSFSHVETSVAARYWMELCAPQGRHYGFEHYAGAGARLLRRPVVGPPPSMMRIEKVEGYDAPSWEALGLDYFMRTPSRTGRYAIDPRTGRRFPDLQRQFDDTMSRSVLLKTWCAAPDNRPKFSQFTLELYAALPADGEARTPPAAARGFAPPPFFIHGGPFSPLPLRVCNDSTHLGPVEAMSLSRRFSTIFFDPIPPGFGSYYAVVMNFADSGSASVRWTRGFTPRRASVPPRGAALFKSTSGLPSFWSTVATSRVRAKGVGRDDLVLVAVTADPFLAADLLRRHGAVDAGDELARQSSWRLPFVPAVPEFVRDDFSRLYTGPFEFISNLPRHAASAQTRKGVWARFPVVLEPGPCSLRLFLLNDPRLTEAACEGDPARAPVPEFHGIGARILSARPVGWALDGSLAFDLDLEADGSGDPFLLGIPMERGITSFKASGAEFRWRQSPTPIPQHTR